MLKEFYLQNFQIDGDLHDTYLQDVPAIKHLKRHAFQKPVTFLVGENGTGKSTLLEALAIKCGFNAEGGSKNFIFSTTETHSSLHSNMRIVRKIPFAKDGFFLRAESFYNVASEIDRLDKIHYEGTDYSKSFIQSNYGGRSLHEQSHGESFLALISNRFHKNSLFFLDEPEAALSPMRLLTFLVELDDLVKHDCQFIIATHSTILMAYEHAEIIEFTEDDATVIPYQETAHYKFMRSFINEPEHYLYHLLSENYT